MIHLEFESATTLTLLLNKINFLAMFFKIMIPVLFNLPINEIHPFSLPTVGVWLSEV